MDCFLRLEGQEEPARVGFRFVLGLLLMRRRRLKLDGETREDGREVLRMRCPRTGTVHEVVNPRLSDGELTAVQDDVFEALGWE
jgi:hypothetical protein